MPSNHEARAIIRVSGADAVPFLQGQLCNDIAAVTESQGQISALSTPKGRVLAIFRVFAMEQSLLLTLPASLADQIAATLRRYVLRSRVALDVNPDGMAALTGCQPPRGLDAPEGPFACEGSSDTRVMRLAAAAPLFEMVGTASGLAEQIGAEDDNAVATAIVSAGLPDIFPATSGAFVAQMLNLDRLDGISFTKGCYTGQEIIARTQNLGRIKRRMLRFSATQIEGAPVPGDSLHAGRDGAAVGKVVSTAHAASGLGILAVMRLDALEQGDIFTANGARLVQEPLPYPL